MTNTSTPKIDMTVLAAAWDACTLNGHTEGTITKDAAHRATAAFLKTFATKTLGLNADQYEISSNKGGVAIPGEVTLYVDRVGTAGVGLFLQVGSSCGVNRAVMYRTSEGKIQDGKRTRFDCGAGMRHVNNFASATDFFANPAKYAAKVKQVLGIK